MSCLSRRFVRSLASSRQYDPATLSSACALIAPITRSSADQLTAPALAARSSVAARAGIATAIAVDRA